MRDAGSDRVQPGPSIDPILRIPDPGIENFIDPPPPDWRRRLHDAVASCTEAPVSRCASFVSGRAVRPPGGPPESASRRGDRCATSRRRGAHGGRSAVSRPTSPRALRRRDRSARWTSKRLARVAIESAGANRVPDPGADLDVYPCRRETSHAAPATLGGEPVGPARSDRWLVVRRTIADARRRGNATRRGCKRRSRPPA